MFWIKTLMQVETQREVSCYITGQPVNGEIKEWRWLGEYFAAYAMRVNEMWRLERVTIMDKSKLSSDMRTVGQDWRSQPLVLYYYSLDTMVIGRYKWVDSRPYWHLPISGLPAFLIKMIFIGYHMYVSTSHYFWYVSGSWKNSEGEICIHYLWKVADEGGKWHQNKSWSIYCSSIFNYVRGRKVIFN